MEIHEAWERALKNTEIIRSRVQALMTFADTKVPYVLLSESTINAGDTVVRKGEILVERPSLILPPNIPQFEGFEFEKDNRAGKEEVLNFLLVRGINLPSLKYNNKTYSLDIFEGRLNDAIRQHMELLQQKEDVHTGLITGPEDCWQFSALIFICTQVARSAEEDIKRLLDEYKKRPN
ncbi:MAG TPA: hypothetical protein PL155_09145 [Candidatus Omnitrophota bacterium]|nr:hypothetical protein [Candidatus Omnitrophota bacterium]HPD85657.1 hypothetical protein [Candidatus Omnitrophota bacterium]HRZ04500.1 hypothetical protein [Candidatus Omnitrophota bacterium]